MDKFMMKVSALDESPFNIRTCQMCLVLKKKLYKNTKAVLLVFVSNL